MLASQNIMQVLHKLVTKTVIIKKHKIFCDFFSLEREEISRLSIGVLNMLLLSNTCDGYAFDLLVFCMHQYFCSGAVNLYEIVFTLFSFYKNPIVMVTVVCMGYKKSKIFFADFIAFVDCV